MKKNSFIRTIYLYIFALAGLITLVIGVGRLVDLGLKMTIFKNADVTIPYYERPMAIDLNTDKAQIEELQACSEECELTAAQKATLALWLSDYDQWSQNQKENAKIDYTRQNRERQASSSIAQIIVGLPLYLYHWMVIKRDRKEQEDEA